MELAKSSHKTTLLASNQTGLQCIFTVVYGKNWASSRKSLWAELCHISDTHSHLPWSVLGNFNVARFTDEKIDGKPLSIQKLKDFNDYISYCSLSDIISSGSKWTWLIRSEVKIGSMEGLIGSSTTVLDQSYITLI